MRRAARRDCGPAVVTAGSVAPCYYALRVCPLADAPRWWASAQAIAWQAPAAIQAILAGRARIEVTANEAIEALAWAQSIDGWKQDDLTPVWVYPTSPAEH